VIFFATARHLSTNTEERLRRYRWTRLVLDQLTVFRPQGLVAIAGTKEAVEAAIESLMRISQTAPQLLLPAHGAPMRSHVRAFRSLNLFVNNLMSNIQYALDGPRSIAEIRSRDLGYVPRDLIRFAGSARMAYAVLEELHRVGVAVREGEGPTGTFHIQRPSRL
jgi:hypothetical protein